jgi:hypothetical protein
MPDRTTNGCGIPVPSDDHSLTGRRRLLAYAIADLP